MSDWLARVQDAVQAAGFDTRLWHAGDGGLLLSTYAARIVGCQLPGVSENIFWNSPDIEDPAKAKDAMKAAGSRIGGDRLWIAPEVAYNWPNLAAARIQPFGANYLLPPEMDPAEWRIVENLTGHLHLTAQMTLVDRRVNKNITLRVNRQFNLVGRPEGLPKTIRSASFAIRNDLATLETDGEAVAGAWDLLQVPTGGVLVCPTLVPVRQVRRYYASFRDQDIIKDGRSVRFHARGDRVVKFGLSAQQTTGRMAYLRRAGRVTTAIVRIFEALPGEPYVDLPRDSSQRFGGDALQAFCDDGRFGSFAEMEYHDPALIAGASVTSRSGYSVTHVLAGPDAPVRKAAAELVGVRV
jgi:hypothetical protein